MPKHFQVLERDGDLNKLLPSFLSNRLNSDGGTMSNLWHASLCNSDQCGQEEGASKHSLLAPIKTNTKIETVHWCSSGAQTQKTWFKRWDMPTPLQPSALIYPKSPIITRLQPGTEENTLSEAAVTPQASWVGVHLDYPTVRQSAPQTVHAVRGKSMCHISNITDREEVDQWKLWPGPKHKAWNSFWINRINERRWHFRTV